MKADEFLKRATKGTEAGEIIEESHLRLAIIKLLENYREIVVKECSIPDVSEMFDFAGYLYGNFDYHDNTKEGDIYMHNDNKLKYTKEKVYKQWIGIRNSR